MFVDEFMVNGMFFPRLKVTEWRLDRDGGVNRRPTVQSEVENGQGRHQVQEPLFVSLMPKDCGFKDCLVHDFKTKTIDEQRQHFASEMRRMAGEGREQEDGWVYK